MSKIIDHIQLVDESCTAVPEYLETYKTTESDKTQNLVEQTLFALYLASVGIDNKYFDNLRMNCAVHKSATVRNLGFILGNIQKGVIGRNELDVNDVLFILNEPRTSQCPLTITAKFIYQLLPLIGVTYHTDVYEDNIIYNPCLYSPCVHDLEGTVETTERRKLKQFEVLSIFTSSMQGEYSLSPKLNEYSYGLRLLDQFKLENSTFEQYIAVLAAFSVPSMQYSIDKNAGVREYQTLCAVCRDLVSESHCAKWVSQYTKSNAINNFLKVIASKIESGEMSQIADCDLFAKMMQHVLGIDEHVKNYCIKPVNQITAREALAFRNSNYANIIQDRIMASMEALEGDSDSQKQDEDSEDASEDEPATDSDLSESNDTNEDNSTEDNSIDENSNETALDTSEPETDDASQKNDDKPRIDPGMMLLELANPSETMSDYMYRSIVSRRISAILKNPPENAGQDDLLMLKRWRSRWLYIVSIPCIREFISRLAIRLSD